MISSVAMLMLGGWLFMEMPRSDAEWQVWALYTLTWFVWLGWMLVCLRSCA